MGGDNSKPHLKQQKIPLAQQTGFCPQKGCNETTLAGNYCSEHVEKPVCAIIVCNQTTNKGNYCDDHSCRSTDCQNQVIEHQFCLIHRCPNPTCENELRICKSSNRQCMSITNCKVSLGVHDEHSFCPSHQCPILNCEHEKKDKGKACSVHTCREGNCTQQIFYLAGEHTEHCKYHICCHITCLYQRNLGDSYCGYHEDIKCQYGSECDRTRVIKTAYCRKHQRK